MNTAFTPSLGVLRMMRLRLDAAHGTPTIWEKLAALVGQGGASQAATLAGVQRDLTADEQTVVALFQPLLHSVESTGLTDLTTFLSALLAGAPTITSVNQAVTLATTAIQGESTAIQGQLASVGQTSFVTLVSAALAALGHLNLPVA